MMTDDLTTEIVRELLDYCSETGRFTWLPRSAKWFSTGRDCKAWNTRYSGKEAFTANSRGYRVGGIFDKTYEAHRIAWLHFYGVWPSEQIDHINQDRGCNRINNLRDVVNLENGRNQKKHVTNTSGTVGVVWNKGRMRWQAQIMVGGKMKYLGIFDQINDAITARKLAQTAHAFHENHGSSTEVLGNG